MRTKQIDIEKLQPNPKNARLHGARDLMAIQASLSTFGQQKPIVVDENMEIIAGHGTVEAAKGLGWNKISVVVSQLTGDEAIAYAIADNRTAELSSWDAKELLEALENIEDQDARLAAGFDEKSVRDIEKQLWRDANKTKPQTKTERFRAGLDALRDKWKTEPGQLWTAGDHLVLCGDATDPANLDRLGGEFDLTYTDPPYGVGRDYLTYEDSRSALVELINGFFPLVRKRSKIVCITTGVANLHIYPAPDWTLCWFYCAGTGRTPWGFTTWQPFAVWGKDPKLQNNYGAYPDGYSTAPTREALMAALAQLDMDEARQDVDGYQKMMSPADMVEVSNLPHDCPKPRTVWTTFLRRLSTDKTKTVLDPFLGAGTTLVCAEELGLHARGIEIDPAYVALCLERYESETGTTPTLHTGA